MALRDIWAKLTGREKEKPAEEAPPPAIEPAPAAQEEAAPAEAVQPAITAPAPPETRSPDEPPAAPQPPPLTPVAPPELRSPLPRDILPPGDLPHVPTEVPPPVPPAGPARPLEVPSAPPPAEAPPREDLPEQPAPPPAPSQAPPAPPGWQPAPSEQPIPATPAAPATPPPEAPPLTPPPGMPVPPPEVPAPPPRPPEPSAPPEREPEPPPGPAEPGEPERGAAPPAVTAFLPTEPTPVAEEPAARAGWFGRLRAGLSRSTARLTDGITGLFHKRKLDDAALEELEEALITADLGVAASQRIVEQFRRSRFGKEVTDQEVKEALAAEIATILEPVAEPLVLDDTKRPHVVLVVGVNGTGKTTTIAKLGQQWREEGRSVGFVAGDTFRAAAVEQLQIWGERTGCQVFAPAKEGADAAALAFDALKQAQAEGTEVLLVDTAGRLHNKSALMEELRKVVRVMQRVDASAPHSVLLVLDATTGQNATQQCKVFGEMVNVSGLVVTKLDGSAKGGIVVALAQEFGLPVHAVGVGEKAADLRPFGARDFARSLLGLG